MGHRKIAFVQIESILKEGIQSIIKQDKIDCSYISFASVDSFINYKKNDSVDIVIVSSNISSEGIKKLSKCKNDLLNIQYLGFISSAYKRNFEDVIDKHIFLSDSTETILQQIRSMWIEPEMVAHNENLLSDREVDVLKLLVCGKQNKEIAEDLCISVHTVVSHRKNITHKLGVKSLAAMAIYAVSKNIIDLNESMSLLK